MKEETRGAVGQVSLRHAAVPSGADASPADRAKALRSPERSYGMQAAFSERFKAGDWSAPAARLVGFYPTTVGDGEAIFEMEANRSHHNPMGTVHGGILSALADSAMGFAFASTLGPGESFTTVELKINYLRPVFGGHLKAAARLVHRGKSIGLAECDVFDGEGKLVAHAVSTCSVLGGEKARGR